MYLPLNRSIGRPQVPRKVANQEGDQAMTAVRPARQTAGGARSTGMESSEPSPALIISKLSKTFGTRAVLQGVSFAVNAGTVHALLGGNGSGKSTLVKSLAGVQSADAGGTLQVGNEIVPSEQVSPTWARKHGLRFVHQNPGIFPSMSVAENIAMVHGLPARAGWVRRRRLEEVTRELLAQFEIDVSPTARMGDLRLAEQTMVAIARALHTDESTDERISALVLDEPTAALPEEDVQILLDSVRRAAGSGVAVLYVSHRLEEVLSIADSVTVLRDGREVDTRSAQGLTERDLVEAIVGQPLTELYPQPSQRASSETHVVAEAQGVSGGPLRDITLRAHAGEILGIAGLLGSGRTELLQMFFGRRPITAGSLVLDGRAFTPSSASDAMAAGVAYVPEDREIDAVFPDLSLRLNLSAADITRYSRLGRIRRRYERAEAAASMTAFCVRASGTEALMSSLSGGNQQKVILARWLRRKPRLLLLDEPTQGVDVGARADAYRLIRTAVDEGAAAILVSSDFEELAEMSDRVVILCDGRVTAEIRGSNITRHRLTELVFLAGEAQS